MPTYSAAAVSDSVIAHKKGVTLQMLRALRDNTLAIAENDGSVPDELRPRVLIGTATMTGSSVVLDPVDLSSFGMLYFLARNISFAANAVTTWNVTCNSATIFSFPGNAGSENYTGVSNPLFLHSGQIANVISTITDATTTLTFSRTNVGGSPVNFDAGTIEVWGMK